jgi:hypothetical protein
LGLGDWRGAITPHTISTHNISTHNIATLTPATNCITAADIRSYAGIGVTTIVVTAVGRTAVEASIRIHLRQSLRIHLPIRE